MHLKIENMYGNSCEWKSVEICVMLFKNWKQVFEIAYQTGGLDEFITINIFFVEKSL